MRTEVFAWAMFALALIIAELIAPGVFMLWLGFAAVAVMLLVWLLPGMPFLWQALIFVVLGLISIRISRRWLRRFPVASDQPLLNRRAEQLVGQIHPLESAIVNGRGRVKIGDAFWAVEGHDAPVGTRVRIASVHGMSLRVEPEA
jgi:membrane protein implicated in regulation of membrane protease activity